MCFTKYYRKRLAILAVVLLCFLLSFMNSLFRVISDDLLDAAYLQMQRTSAFNPRAISYHVLSFVNAKASSKSPRSNDLSDGITFHWDDWVDLSPGSSILDKVRTANPAGECSAALGRYSAVNPYFMESYDTKVHRGMANLYCLKDIPKRVLVLTDLGFIEVPVTSKRRIGSENMAKDVTKLDLVAMMARTPEQLLSSKSPSLKYHPYVSLKKNLDVDPHDFVFDLDKEIISLKEKLIANNILPDDVEHLRFLEDANAMVDLADRFFKYPWIYSDLVAGRSHHLSAPFFKRFISNRERQSVIQHMVRAWFKFAEASGAVSWINYGSLLGWAYNGVNMPWDTDVDIQIPIAQLDKLSRKFNSTIIIENPKDGNAKYLFEVSPTYIRHGNGRNFIDARFIEINSGLYIDISVLSHTGEQPPSELMEGLSEDEKLRAMPVHCKNWNWHLLDEILPLRHTFFEDSSVYIPKNILSILLRKYGRESFTTKLLFFGHHYDKDLLLWVPDSEPSRECKVHRNLPMSESLLENCKSALIKDEYKIVYKAAQRHKELNANIDVPAVYDVEAYPELPLSRKDPWEYFDDIIHKRVSSADWYTD